jgi:hypothetical protein
MSKLSRRALGAACTVVFMLPVIGVSQSNANSMPSLMHQTAALASTAATDSTLGLRLVNRFFTLLINEDGKGLAAFLSPAFQLQRANGTSANRAEYLANPAKVSDFLVTKTSTTRTGNVLVVRYQAQTTEVINANPATMDPAPRLSVFALSKAPNATWQLVAHSNFTALSADQYR